MRVLLMVALVGFGLMACGDNSDDEEVNTDDSGFDYAQACTASGGTVGTESCCLVAVDWGVDSCAAESACRCSADNSHQVQVCECPAGTCYDAASGECG